MDFDSFSILQPWLLGDDEFLFAYEQTGDIQRSWIKKSIAWNFLQTSEKASRSECLQEKMWASQLRVRFVSRPLDWAYVWLGADFASSVQLAAVLVPALVFGVKELVVLREDDGQKFPSALLTACELSGAELVAQLCREELSAVLQPRFQYGNGALLSLGTSLPSFSLPRNVRLWQSPPTLQAGIVFSGGVSWDLDLLHMVHPSLRFLFWGEPPQATVLDLQAASMPVEEFYGDVLYAPSDFLTGKTMLGLENGFELAWCWQELDETFFRVTRTAFLQAKDEMES